ncbi:hypothetical protein [Italian clover phyllody phytoplasma]|uniref:hypothetical protein n=1 Tax=Italian clover phyllody phytoplasma TaxID=1196420 RepID=UPI0002ED1AD3|nr:hypothetical protein [Italian clover phyllody phytoplasma]
MAINKKNSAKPLSKTRKLFNWWLVIALLLTVVTISSLCFKNHFQTQDQKQTIQETINNEKQECLDLYIDQIKKLEEHIKIKEEELKDKELTAAYKNTLTIIKELKEKQKKQIQNIIDFKNYLKQLENKIKKMEQKIKKAPNLEEKHRLTEDKLLTEKELIQLKKEEKTLEEKQELTKIIQNIEEKLKDTNLTATDKTTLNNDKISKENRIQTIDNKIAQIATKINLKQDLAAYQREIEDPNTQAELKPHLNECIQHLQDQLAKLN